MNIDVAKVRGCLKSFEFDKLFHEHLGWDKHRGQLEIPIDGETIQLNAVAQKRGFAAYVCSSIPDRATRLKIDHQVTKTAREHFVIYADQAAGQQVWQWVRREPGKPLASRDHRFDTSQSGDPLIQRLDRIAVSIEEEESLSLVDVAGKTKKAFDVDKVTKKFYDRFKAEHAAYQKFIKGIASKSDLQWYTSIMLNRLMFVYFIQKKGFLDGDMDYLRNRMKQVREIKGKDKFHTFYRYFLLRLFHEGLGKSLEERKLNRELEKLLGKVPYLNGGFFEVHELEARNPDIDIPDKAFEKLFDFFDDFRWHLDERPLCADNEINPDVVGYIFEKYINQKQMGAYYTKEDITEYISKNTIIPFLFDAAEKKCPIAFKPESSLWRLLQDYPDRYIYAAVRHGVIDDQGQVMPLPKAIEAGIKSVAKRDSWNKTATEPFALPTESWREHVARRQRCLDLRDKLQRGEVHTINDLITLNLDIWQFARDAIVNSEGPELLRAFWQAIQEVTVLDPTCGSGAFLFAALRILESLYSDCLERMDSFVQESDVTTPKSPEERLDELIRRGESKWLEFKSTARFDVKTSQSISDHAKQQEVLRSKDKDRQRDILKAVSAMLNTEGGDVLIGVQDNGSSFGIHHDYALFNSAKRNRDHYELWLNSLFREHFGTLVTQQVHISFVHRDDVEVCWLSVSPASEPAYVKDGSTKSLFVRMGNQSRSLEIEEIVKYHKKRFDGQTPPSRPALVASTVRAGAKLKHQDFRVVLAQIDEHPSDRYFILKRIIINNLFGVDIMEEAVEICKLRLFLKLVAQVDKVTQIEPLPDIDFNIRAGNTLVGYVSLDQVRDSQTETFGFASDEIDQIEEDALTVEKCFEQFRAQQTMHGGKVTTEDKHELRRRLETLDGKLDRYLAGEYGIVAEKFKSKSSFAEAFTDWKCSHEPFHWLVEFFGIMASGGFDVIIGNPPYVVYPSAKVGYRLEPIGYATLPTKNLYDYVFERSVKLASQGGPVGLIVQLTVTSSNRQRHLQDFLLNRSSFLVLPFPRRPESMFDGVEMPVAIVLSVPGLPVGYCTSRVGRMYTEERPHALDVAQLVSHSIRRDDCRIAKFGTCIEQRVYSKLADCKLCVHDLTTQSSLNPVYYQEACRYWLKATPGLPYFTRNGEEMSPPHGRTINFISREAGSFVTCLLNSSLFYWYYTIFSDCEHVNDGLVRMMPISDTWDSVLWKGLSGKLMKSLSKNARRKTINTAQGHVIVYDEMKAALSKPVIDEVDKALAGAYGLNETEVDFIENFDIKYRTSSDDDGE